MIIMINYFIYIFRFVIFLNYIYNMVNYIVIFMLNKLSIYCIF